VSNVQKSKEYFLLLNFIEDIKPFKKEGLVLVFLAKRVHLIPFRTQQLSSSAPMILGVILGK
jgi:hypothetical protein